MFEVFNFFNRVQKGRFFEETFESPNFGGWTGAWTSISSRCNLACVSISNLPLTFRTRSSFASEGPTMSVRPGDKLGSYEILSQLGAGGMGEVYHAGDTTLGREVAVKVLPEAFAKDAERLARFEREARLLATLNHHNIATIRGLEQSGNVRFLVMELVPGETLAERIKQSAIPFEEALPLLMQIAEAFDAAYEKGVIHRDLKPA